MLAAVTAWRDQYNQQRRQSAVGYRTPYEFANRDLPVMFGDNPGMLIGVSFWCNYQGGTRSCNKYIVVPQVYGFELLL